jgi:hypothetical protein
MSKGRAGATAYWTITVILIGFGVLGLLSIGFPFLLLGIALAIVSQRRHETGLVAGVVAATVGFSVGYVLIAPLTCSTSAGSADPVEHTVCSNILGIDYSGGGSYNPSLLPALIAGLVVAVLAALGARWLARRIASRRTPPPPLPA